jgi:serine/threonine protein kinase
MGNKSSSLKTASTEEGEFKYTRKLEIGKGGFGTVYLIESYGKEYALKKIKYNSTWFSHTSKESALKEVEIHKAMTHDHVVKLHDYWIKTSVEAIAGGTLYLLMEYCKLGSCRIFAPWEVDDRVKIINYDLCLRFLNQMISALEYIHERGIAHRDVKLDNIFMRADGGFCLGDFGISTGKIREIYHGDSKTFAGNMATTVKTDSLAGTALYMDPRSFVTLKSCGRSADLYALGVSYREMLAGTAVFNIKDFDINRLRRGCDSTPYIYSPEIGHDLGACCSIGLVLTWIPAMISRRVSSYYFLICFAFYLVVYFLYHWYMYLPIAVLVTGNSDLKERYIDLKSAMSHAALIRNGLKLFYDPLQKGQHEAISFVKKFGLFNLVISLQLYLLWESAKSHRTSFIQIEYLLLDGSYLHLYWFVKKLLPRKAATTTQ